MCSGSQMMQLLSAEGAANKARHYTKKQNKSESEGWLCFGEKMHHTTARAPSQRECPPPMHHVAAKRKRSPLTPYSQSTTRVQIHTAHASHCSQSNSTTLPSLNIISAEEVYSLLKLNSLHTTRQSDTADPKEMKRTQIRNSLLSTGVQVCWDQPGFPIPRQHWSVAFVAEVAEQFVSALCPSACLQILPQWEKSNPANSNSNNYILAVPSTHKNTALRPSHWKHFPSPLSPHTFMYSNSTFHQRFKISFDFNAIWYFSIFSTDVVSISSSKNRSATHKGPGVVFVKKHTLHSSFSLLSSPSKLHSDCLTNYIISWHQLTCFTSMVCAWCIALIAVCAMALVVKVTNAQPGERTKKSQVICYICNYWDE